MRVALCLHGKPRDLERGHAVLQRFMKKHTNTTFDVYLHAWTEDRETEQKILDLYKPVSHKFEQQIEFDVEVYKNTIAYKNSDITKTKLYDKVRGLAPPGKTFVWLALSHLYSRNQCQKLLLDLTYDTVITSRYDLTHEIKIHLHEEDLSCLYAHDGNFPRFLPHDSFNIMPPHMYKKVMNTYDSFLDLFNNVEVEEKMAELNETFHINTEEIFLASIIYHNFEEYVIQTPLIPYFI